MTVINNEAGPSTRFPAKSVVDTCSCVDENIHKFIFLNDDGALAVTHIYSKLHNTVRGYCTSGSYETILYRNNDAL